MDLSEFILEEMTDLLESKNTSMVRRTKTAKRQALAGRSAMSIAKEKNPSLYNRYLIYKEKYYDIRDQILSKYATRGMTQARKSI
jgi:hypothetical protein